MSRRQPSVFTPFFSRFTDQKSAELAETEELYQRVARMHAGFAYADEDEAWAFRARLFGRFRERVPEPLRDAFYTALSALVRAETTIFELPSFEPSLSLRGMVELRDGLRRKEHFHANERRDLGLLEDTVVLILGYIAGLLPDVSEPSPFTIPLIYALPEPKKLIDDIFGTLWKDPLVEAGLFVEVTRRMHFNLCAASGIKNPEEPERAYKLASQSDAPLSEVVETYLRGTPFLALFVAPVPLKLSHEERMSHMQIVGGSGAGKTQLLQNLILHDLLSEDPPALVIVDSQGDLIDKISHLALFAGPLKDRLILITPKDIDHPPALNIFDVNRSRLGRYDAVAKEQVTAGVIETFDYLFSGLIGADLTAKQGVFFRYIARLMLALPETMGRSATILDLMHLMDDPEPYRDAIESLPEIQRQFFVRDFVSRSGRKGTFDQTREQIRYRLQALIENPTLARLFTSPSTKIDLFDELNRGSIILVDTAGDFLKGASPHFGRIFIALTLQAVLERAAIPEEDRRPAFLIVDEAAEYFDSNIDNLLTGVRKYRLGCVFAHQYLDQCTPNLRASLAASTAIKMAGGGSTADARALAPDMRTTPDFILSQPRLHFACHIRNVTPQAVSISVAAGKLEREPRLGAAAYEELRRRNRERVSLLDKREERRGARLLQEGKEPRHLAFQSPSKPPTSDEAKERQTVALLPGDREPPRQTLRPLPEPRRGDEAKERREITPSPEPREAHRDGSSPPPQPPIPKAPTEEEGDADDEWTLPC
jgi:Type IV secretion-system coupling protein DNA-binding domain